MEYKLKPLSKDRTFWVYNAELGRERAALVGQWTGTLCKETGKIPLLPSQATKVKQTHATPELQHLLGALQEELFVSVEALEEAQIISRPMDIFRASEYGVEAESETYLACIRYSIGGNFSSYVHVYDKEKLREIGKLKEEE